MPGIGSLRVPKISRYRSFTGGKVGFGRAPACQSEEDPLPGRESYVGIVGENQFGKDTFL